jgi:endonuclease/exonuclease/phosphatase family metal-dependent hydrolase
MYFTGDFNMTPSDQGYATMLAWGNKDARVLSGNINQEFTCGNSIIDYCFIANDTFQVTDFDVGYGLEGSDHYPVYTELYIK